MKYDRTTETVIISCEELSSFAVKKISKNNIDSTFKPVYLSEPHGEDSVNGSENVSLNCRANIGEQKLIVTATVDSLVIDGGRRVIESIKHCRKPPARFTPASDPEFLAKSIITAFVYCFVNKLDSVVLRLTLKSGGECRSREGIFSFMQASFMTKALIERADPFIRLAVERGSLRIDELKNLKFPHDVMREGQKDFMVSVMRAVRKGGNLLAGAPTGIGKTISALYPSLKSIGNGYADKIFYLTSKNVTGKAAMDAMKYLSTAAPHARAIMIVSKESICASDSFKDGCYFCPMLNDTTDEGALIPYKTRRDEAVIEVLESGSAYGPEIISEVARKYNVCPYELSLDVGEFCDVIVCDYNYAFDRRVRFKRYFVENKNDEEYIFLIDEAHNLPDRVRSMYSAGISNEDLRELISLTGGEYSFDAELKTAVSRTVDSFEIVKKLCEENSVLSSDGSDDVSGYYKSYDFPIELHSAICSLAPICFFRARQKDENSEVFEKIYQKLSKLLSVLESADEKFKFLAQRKGNNIRCDMLCLDPSEIIIQTSKIARSVIMFSATLNPSEYFMDSLGIREDEYIELDSPYDKDNLCVSIFNSVSTRLKDRKRTAGKVAEIIEAAVSARRGKYLVYFPSHSYMQTVCKEYLRLKPTGHVVMQKSSMSKKERNRFISVFLSEKYESVTGFCVLGGMFSEGLDLAGDSLIGVIVVGLGLSGASSELNLITEYYDDKYERGYEFAYLFPAINKIQQAVGRVIRAEEDRGAAILIDHRLSDPGVRKLLPKFWSPVKCVSEVDSMIHVLEKFWEEDGRGDF